MDCFVCLTSLLCSFVCKSHSPFQPSVPGYASDFFSQCFFPVLITAQSRLFRPNFWACAEDCVVKMAVPKRLCSSNTVLWHNLPPSQASSSMPLIELVTAIS
ncbi:hypothetical protein EmuJ_000042400 [Echinococcus multilocularis]|uniref:Secreted protein n=1 Tax=Echinococcus multilocularis TaxID=6211 RepID=A0A087VX39_ECHMU|nr:hypothetical protein EmuJ_000042400 [Echinococcus multilocularis]